MLDWYVMSAGLLLDIGSVHPVGLAANKAWGRLGIVYGAYGWVQGQKTLADTVMAIAVGLGRPGGSVYRFLGNLGLVGLQQITGINPCCPDPCP